MTESIQTSMQCDLIRANAVREVETNIAAGWNVRSSQESQFLTQFCRELARQADLIDGGLA